MILIKWKQVNREVPSSNPADFIYQFSIFHVISYVTKTLNSYKVAIDLKKLKKKIIKQLAIHHAMK